MTRVESLCAVIGEEVHVCVVLAAVLRDEQAAVVALRPQAILSCVEQRQVLHDALVQLAERRRTLVREEASTRGSAAVSVTGLLPLLPPDPRARVREGLAALRRALLEARSLEHQNERLVSGGLETVDELLRVLRALVPGARYGADAQLAPAAAGAERLNRHV
jgi:flagellar biosynthesis/type III secretory pathway chaperone